MQRCKWAEGVEMVEYHDREWGVPVYDDARLFEFLVLEGAQAGLSWLTILKRREGYRKAFDSFNIEKIARYSDRKAGKLLKNADIIRNRLKIEATILNARNVVKLQKEFGSFRSYLWGFVGNKPMQNRYKSLDEIPACTMSSDELSKDLRKQGFKFVGSTICYAFMQAVGMVNDHEVDCFRWKEVNQLSA